MGKTGMRALSLALACVVILGLAGCGIVQMENTEESTLAMTAETQTQPNPEETTIVQETEPEILEGSLFLKTPSITFSVVGESEDIYLGVIPRELVSWQSEAPDVVAVENGILIAVGVGTTTIRASYADREVSCIAGCLAQTQEELEKLDAEVLSTPKWLPPEIDLEQPCTYFDNAAIVGDSITYVLMQNESISNALGDVTFLCRGGVSAMGFVLRSKNLYFGGREQFLEDVVAKSQVERIYVLLGSNDVGAGYDMDTLIGNCRTILERIREKSPEIEIVWISSIPRFNRSGNYNTRTIEYNSCLRDFAKENNCMYLDLHSYVQDHLGRLPNGYRFDDTHLDETGCNVWMKVMRYYAQYESEGGILN